MRCLPTCLDVHSYDHTEAMDQGRCSDHCALTVLAPPYRVQ
jgi:hypothetical protein